MYAKFGEILQRMGITPYKVSKETGISQSTLTNWKNGTYTPKMDKLQKIADYLGVSVGYFCSKENYDAVSGKVPVIKSCIEQFSLTDKENICEYAPVIYGWKSSFCLICDDPSLKIERMEIGDTIYFDSQEIVGGGELAGVLVDGKVMVRRIYYCDSRTIVAGVNGEAPLVLAENEVEKIKILGRVVGFTSKL
jgi:transcriptional regulator with XRE-family HTH domain